MLDTMLANVRDRAPLVHCITNYVTVTDVANMLLASGGAPIMSDDPADVEDIQTVCGGLDINIGTLNQQTIPAMLLAGKRANELGHPVLLDPVGAGASKLRTETAQRIIREVKLACIRGNISEVKALALGSATTKGVEADVADKVTDESLAATVEWVKRLAADTDAVIAITGEIDIVADANRAFALRNGSPVMSKITGSGCMLSALTTGYLVANPEKPLLAVVAAICSEGIAGEKAAAKMEADGVGNSTFRNYLIDNIYLMTPEELEAGARYEEC